MSSLLDDLAWNQVNGNLRYKSNEDARAQAKADRSERLRVEPLDLDADDDLDLVLD